MNGATLGLIVIAVALVFLAGLLTGCAVAAAWEHGREQERIVRRDRLAREARTWADWGSGRP